MAIRILTVAAASCLLLATAVQAQTPLAPTPATPQTATANLVNASGATIGQAVVTEAPKGVLLRVEAKGLAPGWHGLHFHEVGDCSKSDFTTAGGHIHTDTTRVHGLLNAANNENGDLPNLHVGADGLAAAEFYSDAVSLRGASGRPPLAGKSIIIHANPDDQLSQPIGGAGARVACGVIK
jgi:Cu-Zn family superoxide dismutase